MKHVNGFELDDTNIILRDYYCYEENYRIEITDINNKRCIIFFSGNGLYYPDTLETFQKVVMIENRYEWTRVADTDEIRQYYGKIIFIRDIYKSFYVKGINSRLDNIDKVLSFLQKETEGYHVVTCGNSAGGYMAVIAGDYLHADCIFSFGGQWNIEDYDHVYIKKYKEKYGNYYDICKYAAPNVAWFYSALNDQDSAQKNILGEGMDHILSFAIASKYHGDLLLFPCYEQILCISNEGLNLLYKKYKGRLISQRKFAKELLNWKAWIDVCVQDFIRHHKSLQIVRDVFKKRIFMRKSN